MVLGDNVKVASVSVLVEEVNILITSALSSLHILDKASVMLHARRLENKTPLRYSDTVPSGGVEVSEDMRKNFFFL